MALSVIGAGFGRTGTLSLKLALERLGFGPCYHMTEIFADFKRADPWLAAARGERVDWDDVLSGYKSVVDWPACHFWREFAQLYPQAKVLLGVRDPAKWYDSISNTIFLRLEQIKGARDETDPAMRAAIDMVLAIVAKRTFGWRFDAAHAIEVFEEHIAAVKREIPGDRLLVYESGEGWEPLCRFLGVAVPDEAFPRVNAREAFWEAQKDRPGAPR